MSALSESKNIKAIYMPEEHKPAKKNRGSTNLSFFCYKLNYNKSKPYGGKHQCNYPKGTAVRLLGEAHIMLSAHHTQNGIIIVPIAALSNFLVVERIAERTFISINQRS